MTETEQAQMSRLIEVSFHLAEGEQPPPPSVVLPALERLDPSELPGTEREERFAIAVDSGHVWVRVGRDRGKITCIVKADGPGRGIAVLRDLIAPWLGASFEGTGGEVLVHEDSGMGSPWYYRGSGRDREVQRHLRFLEERFVLFEELRRGSDLDDAHACALRLFEAASRGWEARRTDTPEWVRCQAEAPGLGGSHPASALPLAIAFLEASGFEEQALAETGSRTWPRMEAEAALWLAEEIPERLGWELDRHSLGQSPDIASALSALWNLPGEEGTRWVERMVRSDEDYRDRVRSSLGASHESLLDGEKPLIWSEEDAIARMNAIADAAPKAHWSAWAAITAAPRTTAIAQARIAHAYSESPVRGHLVELVAKNIRSHLSGDPSSDLELFEWDAPRERARTVRYLLGASLTPEARTALVAAALEAARISQEESAFFLAEEQIGVAKESDWSFDPPRQIGTVDLGSGTLGAGTPFEGAAWQIELPAGAHNASLVIATKPGIRDANAALELIGDPEAVATQWEPVPGPTYQPDGFVPEWGTAMFGPPETFELVEPFDDSRVFEALHGAGSGGIEIPVDGFGRVVAVTVAEQHALCRTWVGRDSNGRIVRTFTELGEFGLDPSAGSVAWL